MGELKRSAWLVVAAALVPLLLFLILQAAFQARSEQRDARSQAVAASVGVMTAVDNDVRRNFALLSAVATARSLRSGDLLEFTSRAAEYLSLNPGWRGIELIDLDTRAVFARAGPLLGVVQTTASLPRSGPRFAGLASGPGCPCVMFDRLAVAGRHRWAVRVMVSNKEFQTRLPAAKGQYEVSAIVDPHGMFIARSLSGDQRFGKPASRFLRGAVASGAADGVYRATTLEGFESYTAFARSSLTGWTTHVAMARAAIDTPARRFFASIGLAALLSLALATILVVFALRQVAVGRRIAERMQQAQKLEALGQLTGGIAHDFNNLLTPVVGSLDFLVRKPDLDPSTRRLLDGALASARRAGKLTAQLLAFSRRQKLAIEPTPVVPMLDGLSDLLRQSVGNGHRLVIVQDDPRLCAMSDHNQLELAVLNLTLNARDASPEGATITIDVRGTGTPDDGKVIIRIIDEGSGMDDETRRRAMEPFFTTKAIGRGTGLGLAQAFGMATQSGGDLAIDSSPGKGTTVTLTLPRCSEREEGAPPSPFASGEDQRPLRLLVVDDDPLVRSAIVHPLEQAGHFVDMVSDGPTALAALRQRAFDLVLVDYAMPDMTGADVIRLAGDVRPDQRFVIVSGYADSDAIADTARDTIIVRKPFDPADLLAVVERTASD